MAQTNIRQISCEHFIFGSFKGIGYKLIKSSGIDKLLSQEDIQYLCRIGISFTQEAYVTIYLPQDNALASLFIQPKKDEFKRDTTWVHAILFNNPTFLHNKFQRLVQDSMNELFPILKPHFISDLNKIPKTLDPLTIEVEGNGEKMA